MNKDDLIKCPHCFEDDSVFEREESVSILKKIKTEISYIPFGILSFISDDAEKERLFKNYKFFCGRCKKDF